MSALRRLDAWIGLRVFHPPIIWLCQRTGMTQWAFYRYGWWIAALWCVWDDDRSSTVWTVMVVIGALIRTFSAGLSLNLPAQPLFFIRLALILGGGLVLLFELAGQYSLTEFADQLGWDVVALAAEYAATISTIPPRRKRERKTSSREAWA